MAYSPDDLKKLGFYFDKNQGCYVKAPEKKKNKFGAKKVEIDGRKFDSKKEGTRYLALKTMQQYGVISELKCQKKFPLVIRKFIVNDQEIDLGYQYMREYIADFTYMRDGKQIVEDVKSKHTKTLGPYKLKKKLMKFVYDIDILET